eukprot:1160240-Pelagomonas_calceolata.AAC.7
MLRQNVGTHYLVASTAHGRESERSGDSVLNSRGECFNLGCITACSKSPVMTRLQREKLRTVPETHSTKSSSRAVKSRMSSRLHWKLAVILLIYHSWHRSHLTFVRPNLFLRDKHKDKNSPFIRAVTPFHHVSTTPYSPVPLPFFFKVTIYR